MLGAADEVEEEEEEVAGEILGAAELEGAPMTASQRIIDDLLSKYTTIYD